MNFNNKVLTFSFRVPADLVYGMYLNEYTSKFNVVRSTS